MNKTPELVDLGLPSGNLWMTKNLGAEKEINFGYYYQFGSLVGYSRKEALNHSTWVTCPFNNGKEYFDKEYFKANRHKWIYKNNILKPEFDIVTQTYGNDYRIPNPDDFEELMENTTAISNYKNSKINGTLLTSKINGKTLFIPYSGSIYKKTFNGIGTYGNLWSSKLNMVYLNFTSCFNCNNLTNIVCYNSRITCYNIRGIRGK